LFDFWCATIGVAIEVDGPEHDAKRDAYRDEYNLRRSGIVVLRVHNRNEQDAADAIASIATADTWKERRERFGIVSGSLQRLVKDSDPKKDLQRAKTKEYWAKRNADNARERETRSLVQELRS
jgi:hypothetical protein